MHECKLGECFKSLGFNSERTSTTRCQGLLLTPAMLFLKFQIQFGITLETLNDVVAVVVSDCFRESNQVQIKTSVSSC